jgi:ribosomal protein L13
MKTYSARASDIEKKWVLIDADGLVVGRLATIIANRLRGKHKASFTPHMDCGDHVIVINAEKVKTTGMKSEQKVYQHYTGYPGGLRTEEFRKRFDRKPELIIEDGDFIWATMRRNHISTHDVEEDMRLSGHTDEVSKVKKARVERSGDVSFVYH